MISCIKERLLCDFSEKEISRRGKFNNKGKLTKDDMMIILYALS